VSAARSHHFSRHNQPHLGGWKEDKMLKRCNRVLVGISVVASGAAPAYADWTVTTHDAPGTGAVTIDSFAKADPVFDSPPAGYTVDNSTVPVADLYQNGGTGTFTGAGFDLPFGPNFPVNTDIDDFVTRVTGRLTSAGGAFDFFTDTDDGGRFRLDLNRNGVFTDPGEELVFTEAIAPNGTPDRSAVVNLENGNYDFEFSFFERAGGAAAEAGYRAGGAGANFALGDAAGGIGATGPLNVRTVGLLGVNPLSNINSIDEGEQVIAGQPAAGTGQFPTINFLGEGDDGLVAPSDAFPGVSGDDFALRASGFVDVLSGTSVTGMFAVNSDDGFRLRQNGVVVAEFTGERDDPDAGTPLFALTLNEGDRLELTYFERAGGDNVEFFMDLDGSLATTGDLILVGDPAGGFVIIPEPAGLSLLLAAGGLSVVRRRRRQL
jgi:hypothetical protein